MAHLGITEEANQSRHQFEPNNMHVSRRNTLALQPRDREYSGWNLVSVKLPRKLPSGRVISCRELHPKKMEGVGVQMQIE